MNDDLALPPQLFGLVLVRQRPRHPDLDPSAGATLALDPEQIAMLEPHTTGPWTFIHYGSPVKYVCVCGTVAVISARWSAARFELRQPTAPPR